LDPPAKVLIKRKKSSELGAIEQGGRGGTRTYFLLELLNKKKYNINNKEKCWSRAKS